MSFNSRGCSLFSFQRRVAFVAEFLARGYPDVALGAESVPFLRMQQKASAYLTIPLTHLILGLTMGALGHKILQIAALG
jgi:hypothetical protein